MPSRKTHAQQARRSGSRLQVPQLNLHFRWLIFRSYSHIMSACAGEGGGGGTGNVHVHKKEDKRRNNANDRRRNSRSRNATLAVRDACTPDMDTVAAAAGAWRGMVESNTCKHTYTVKRIHAIQITTIAAQLQQQQQQWRHLASLISSFNCYR